MESWGKSIPGCGQTGSRGGCGERLDFILSAVGGPQAHDLIYFRTLPRLPGGSGRWEAGEEPAGGGFMVVQFLGSLSCLPFASGWPGADSPGA